MAKEFYKNDAIVYMATNLSNGKRYIGITSIGLKRRQSVHLSKNNKTYFGQALKKYGLESFRWDIIIEGISYQDALIAEVSLIEEFKPEYNSTKGGEGALGHRLMGGNNPIARKIICVDTGRVFDSIMDAARFFSCRKGGIIRVCQGKRKTHKGLCFKYFDNIETRSATSEESRKKISLSLIKRNNPNRRPVICIETGEIFQSIFDAGKKLNMDWTGIQKVCHGKRKQNNGLTFAFYTKKKGEIAI